MNLPDADNRMTVIMVHKGINRKSTRAILTMIPLKVLSVITKIKLNNELKGWLDCNSKGVVVEMYPSFLVTVNGDTTVYKGSQYSQIIDLISDLL